MTGPGIGLVTPAPLALTNTELAEQVIARWRNCPLTYVMEGLLAGRDGPAITPTIHQIEFLLALGAIVRAKIKKFEIETAQEAVRKGEATATQRTLAAVRLTSEERRHAAMTGISWQAGKGIGKDGAISWAIDWFQKLMPSPKSIVTAPTSSQLIDVLWSEVAKWHHGVDKDGRYVSPFHDHHTLASDRFYLNKLEGKAHFTVARTARQSNASQAGSLRGYHEDYQLVVIDEASDVPDPVFASLISTLTRPVNVAIVAYNAVYAHGAAWRTHYDSEEAKDYWQLTHSAEDSPLVSRTTIAKYARSGRDSNVFRINVLGLPPRSEPDVLIPYEFVRAAALKSTHPDEYSTTLPGEEPKIILGIDPAGEGADSTVVAVRHDNTVVRFHENSRLEPQVLLDWLASIIADEKPHEIAIDATGLGWTLAGLLREIHPRVTDVKFQANASDTERFVNKRTEIYWRMREAFVNDQCMVIPNDEFLIQELSTGKYDLAGKNRIALKPKKDVKKVLGYSPDHADALALTFSFSTKYLHLRDMMEDTYAWKGRQARPKPHWSLR